jgi:transposase
VLATRFIGGNRQRNGRRKCLLGRIATRRRATGILATGERDNAARWKLVRDLDGDAAHQISQRIVQFATRHGATILVFEHLGSLQPRKGRYSRAANRRRQYWLKGTIFRCTMDTAWRAGLLTCRVSPWKTSQRCAGCDHQVARYHEGEPPEGYQMGAPLFTCPHCGKRGHADRYAAHQIGRRLHQRYLAEGKAASMS